MSITVGNLRDLKLKPGQMMIKIDRTTPVGNPFVMKTEADRDKVCNQYRANFDQFMQKKEFKDYINHIFEESKRHDIVLGCWCAPKRCHGETIKEYVLEMYDNQPVYSDSDAWMSCPHDGRRCNNVDNSCQWCEVNPNIDDDLIF